VADVNEDRVPAMVSIDSVGLSYPQRNGETLRVLDGISLHLKEGEFVGVVGPSGCGKTTLLRLVAGLIPPAVGSIRLGGDAVIRPSKRTGFVFQDDLLLPWRTVLENILLPLEFRREVNQKTLGFAHDLLGVVGLKGFEKSYPHELSGGMRQRVNLARALVQTEWPS
jgi:NitT/TauT family transport system ATP-binding protein